MNIYKLRREKLLSQIEDHSLVILYSNSIIKQSEDSDYPYFVNRNFFYLTNISQENSLVALVKNNRNNEYLFIDEFDEKKEKWFGKKLSLIEANKLSDIKDVLINKNLLSFLSEVKDSGIKNVYIDFKVKEEIINFIKDEFSKFNLIDVYPILTKMRMVKEENEINDICNAIDITHKGLLSIVDKLKDSSYEYEIYNAFNCEILNYGTHEIAFPSIVASGVHACCLHYPTPNDKLNKDELILCDVGAAYNHYSSDITRTFPISGKFNDFQKKIYNIVLSCNKKVIEFIKPGLNLKDVQEYAKEYLANECLKAGLIIDKKDIEKYYYHSVSHPLGLDTHDIGGRDFTLLPGMILTVEPGLYILEKKIGIRIEDDVLVTENGSKCLSINIPKEINDIEKLFYRR